MMHIQRFIDRIQGFETRGQRDYIMSIKDAKDLHADITKLLLVLESLREQRKNEETTQIVSVDVDGGSFR
jgi:hypothetical protein